MSALSFVILCCWCFLFPVNEEHFQQFDAETEIKRLLGQRMVVTMQREVNQVKGM